MEPEGEQRITFVCCFCWQECPGEFQVLFVERPGTDEEHGQGFFCHPGCFREALHERVRPTLDTDEEVDDELWD